MAHPSPQENSCYHYPYHQGFPTTQPSPALGVTAPGQFYYPPGGQPTFFQPQSSVQMLSQELAAALRKSSQYADLIANLYAELETIRNIVCHHCKERISPANLACYPSAFASPIAVVPSPESHNVRGQQNATPRTSPHPTAGPSVVPFMFLGGSPRVDSPNTQPTTLTSCPNPAFEPTPVILAIPESNTPTPCEPTERPPAPQETSRTKFLKESVVIKAIVDKTEWSVISNREAERPLDITFVHAFKHTSSVNSIRFSPDGKFLAAGHNFDFGKTHVYDVKTRSMKWTLAEYSDRKPPFPPHIWSVLFSPDGQYLVVGASVGNIYIWEIAKKRVRATLKRHRNDHVRSLDLSPDGRFLLIGSYDGCVRIWRLRDGSSKLLIGGRYSKSVRFSPNGRYVAASDSGFLRIWDVRSGQVVGRWIAHDEAIQCMAFTPDGKELVTGSRGEMKSWDVSSLSVPPPSSPVAKHIGEGGMLLQGIKKLTFNGHSGQVCSLAISLDGMWLVTGSDDKRVRVWDMHNAELQCTLEGHVKGLWAVDFSSVGNYIATGCPDGFVTLWRYRVMQHKS